MRYILPLLILCTTLLLSSNYASAQDGSAKATKKEKDESKIRFNGLGRTLLSSTQIEGKVLEQDTNTARSQTDGEFLLDIAINATPNKNTEVQGVLRLRNEFGGFFGAGMSVELQELWARGIVGDVLKYRVGDLDHVMTPYTLYNQIEEGVINEPGIFQPQKDIIYYEQFYRNPNSRRLQGAKLDLGLKSPVLFKDVDLSGFFTRIRGTDFFNTPSRYVSGGHMYFNTPTLIDSLGTKAKIGLNVVHTFDALESSGNAKTGIQNTVYSFSYQIDALNQENLGIQILGEAGKSILMQQSETETIFDEDDTFLDLGINVNLKNSNVSFGAAYIDIGPDFFSMAAQSKRVNFGANKSFYNRIGTDRHVRQPSLFDLSRDRALYSFVISDRLMDYDPRFSNTMPYGYATPNRNGVRYHATYGSNNKPFQVTVGGAILSELRGQGTNELKDFKLLRISSSLKLNEFISWDKKIKVTLGYQNENTTRGGEEIEQVDLKSNLLEAGIEVELFPKFELLAGIKSMSSEGKEYIPEILAFNDVNDFPGAYLADDKESLTGVGIKYEFKKDIYLTLQYQTFSTENFRDPDNDHDLNQVFVLYNMKF